MLPMPQSKGSAAAIRDKAAHRPKPVRSIGCMRPNVTGTSGSSGTVMTTKINSDHPTSTTLHKVTNGLYAIRIEMREGMRGHATGVIVLCDGRIMDGDSYFYYTGTYTF